MLNSIKILTNLVVFLFFFKFKNQYEKIKKNLYNFINNEFRNTFYF